MNPTVASAKLGLQVDDDAVEDMELLIPQEDRKWFVAGKLYELSLNFAIQCLRTAVCLIDQWEAISAEAVTAAAAEEVKDNDGIKLTEKKGGSSNAAGRPAGEGKDTKEIWLKYYCENGFHFMSLGEGIKIITTTVCGLGS